jgi:hypothetical protein
VLPCFLSYKRKHGTDAILRTTRTEASRWSKDDDDEESLLVPHFQQIAEEVCQQAIAHKARLEKETSLKLGVWCPEPFGKKQKSHKRVTFSFVGGTSGGTGRGEHPVLWVRAPDGPKTGVFGHASPATTGRWCPAHERCGGRGGADEGSGCGQRHLPFLHGQCLGREVGPPGFLRAFVLPFKGPLHIAYRTRLQHLELGRFQSRASRPPTTVIPHHKRHQRALARRCVRLFACASDAHRR